MVRFYGEIYTSHCVENNDFVEVYVRTLYTGPGRLGEWIHPDDFIFAYDP